MNIHPIKTKKDYEIALRWVENLMDSKKNTKENDELEVLSILVEKYEEEHFPIASPDPVEAIKFRMEQLGLSQRDLADIIGSSSRASEVLKGKRNLSIKMIRVLHDRLKIPAENLISIR